MQPAIRSQKKTAKSANNPPSPTFLKKIIKILNDLYPAPRVPLAHQDSYTLLIAVLLSAHCTDARVNKVTPQLFHLAATPYDMLKLSVDDIQNIIRSCGLSERKSKAIWDLSKILVENYEGQVPADFKALESLPGVGHKTASVVMTQAFHQAAFPVDTHIHRLAMRWGLSSGKNVKQTEKDLKELFPQKKWNRLHLQMIYFGREYCQARKHDAKLCPICSLIN
jgi:endonuclease-3